MNIEQTLADLQRATTQFQSEYTRMMLLMPKAMGEIMAGTMPQGKTALIKNVGSQSLQNMVVAMDEATHWTRRFNNCMEAPDGRQDGEVAPTTPG